MAYSLKPLPFNPGGDRLSVNRAYAANTEFTLREFKVQQSIRKLRSRVLLLTRITTECVGLPLCNMRFLYTYFQAIVRRCTEPEVLRVQNLRALQIPHASRSTCVLLAFKSS